MKSALKVDSKIQQSLKYLLKELGEDVNREGLLETPKRYEKQLRENLKGYLENPENHVKLFDNDNYHDLVVVSKIAFSSMCEHHILPFYGYVDIAYIPGKKILGLSKFARIVAVFSKRLQVQERLTKQLAHFLYDNLEPEFIMVHISAAHTCMTVRGVEKHDSVTDTIATLGDKQPTAKQYAKFLKHLSSIKSSI